MTDASQSLPEYTVRVSSRATRVRLLVSPREGLVVVVPSGYPASSVPSVVRQHDAWIRRALDRTAERRRHLASAASVEVPEAVDMPGIGLSWTIVLEEGKGETVRARVDGASLVLTGRIEDREACLAAIRRAVARVARERLPLMLGAIETETGWTAERVTVRRQRTRWGSCNAKGAVSLNESLVFLPQHLVRYVLVHELAHTARLDHSPAFWSLVARVDASWPDARSELRSAWRHIPAWTGSL